MLANDPTNPRPRPPAQVRRSTSGMKKSSSSSSSSPPPPYASSLAFPRRSSTSATLLGSPVSATVQMVDGGSQEMVEWLNEKSREELSELLLKADGVIKQRESELDRTSSLYKTLYQDNTSLQSKHRALLSRIPLTPTRVPSPLPSPASTTSSLADPFQSLYSPSSPTSSSSTNPLSKFSSSPSPSYNSSTRRRPPSHYRKVSVSSSDISLLADQNAELLAKIEKLESENASTDLAGRKMLRRLEREIGVLREELEGVREREVKEAKEKEKAKQVDLNASSGQRMRGVSGGRIRRDDDEGATCQVRDFAPGGVLSQSSSSSSVPVSSSVSFPAPLEGIQDEHTLIAHLLSKMSELEQTNARILTEQAETAKKLVEVQREHASLGKVYEGLEAEEVIIEETSSNEDEHEHEDKDDRAPVAAFASTITAAANTTFIPQKPTPTPRPSRQRSDTAGSETIRFRSFRRSLLESMMPMELAELRALGTPGLPSSSSKTEVQNSAARKSVFGLFDPKANVTEEVSRNSQAPPTQTPTSPALSSLSLSINTLGLSNTPGYASASVPGSQASSVLSSPTHTSFNNKALPLSSEMGSFGYGGYGWGNESDYNYSPSHHLRTSSLYDLRFGLGGASEPPSPSPSPSPGPSRRASLEEESIKEEDEHEEGSARLATPEKSGGKEFRKPALTLEPPTPIKFPTTSEDPSSPPTRTTPLKEKETPQQRYRRMSQTVRMRTARWVDGRFGDRERLLAPESPSPSHSQQRDREESGRGSLSRAKAMGSVSGKGKGGKSKRMLMPDFFGDDEGETLASKPGRAEDSETEVESEPTPTLRPTSLQIQLPLSLPVSLPIPQSVQGALDTMVDRFARSVSGSGIPGISAPEGRARSRPASRAASVSSLGRSSRSDSDREKEKERSVIPQSSSTKLVQLYVEPRKSSSKPTNSSSNPGTEMADTSNLQAKSPTASGVGGVILEVWLWLQFAIIILVFLWAMAKRGPKSVLGEGVSGHGKARA